MRPYIRLIRPKHWIKNLLVLLPLLCSGQFFHKDRLIPGVLAFFAFSLLASSIYIINDIRDRENDRRNPSKCGRPIASGAVSVSSALALFAGMLVLALICGIFANGTQLLCWAFFLLYFVLNLIYSFGGKNVPLLDIAILTSGFLLRVIYGGMVTGIPLSHWLCLTVTAASFYLSLGKRRGELLKNPDNPRPVLRYYSRDFLEKNMYMSVALAIVFYALWTVDASNVSRFGSTALVWTVPLVILIFMRYSLIIEDKTDGDPVEVILRDAPLLLLGGLLGLIVLGLIYIP